jgi:hypothetical protein
MFLLSGAAYRWREKSLPELFLKLIAACLFLPTLNDADSLLQNLVSVEIRAQISLKMEDILIEK